MAARRAQRKKVQKKALLKAGGSHSIRGEAFGPAAEHFGKEIAPLGREVGRLTNRVGKLLLVPLKGMVFGLENVGEFLQHAVSERLKDVLAEKIVTPDPRIAVPAIQALVYSLSDEYIRNMFANLLAADMNADKKGLAHPAFVEMIREMTPADAKVLSSFRGGPQIQFRVRLQLPPDRWNEFGHGFSFEVQGLDSDQVIRSVSNLRRLEIVELRSSEWPTVPNLADLKARVLMLNEERARSLGVDPRQERSFQMAYG
jgi:hypothetical protein